MRKSKRSKFDAAMSANRHATTAGPLNLTAISRDATIAISRVSSLLGYSQYLDKARGWKARGAAVSAGFERELQAHAAGAMWATHELASAALRMSKQFKQTGHFDRMLARWVDTIEQSGPVTTADLLADLQSDASVRDLLAEEGILGDTWTELISNLSHIDARLTARDGKLVAELKEGTGSTPRTVTLAREAAGTPKHLDDLLMRGNFERQVDLFVRSEGRALHLVPGPNRDLTLPEIALSAALLSVQQVATHYGGLRDLGLAKYSGRAVVVIWAVVALTALVVGLLLQSKYCKHDGSEESAACIAAMILTILGAIGTLVLLSWGLGALGDLIFGPSASDQGCADTYYYSPLDGSSGCGPKSLRPGESTYP